MAERKILISVDGSKPAEKAFKWYLDNMRREHDHVYLTHVPEYHLNIGLPGRAVDVEAVTQEAKKEEGRIMNMMGKYMDELKKQSVKATEILKTGKPGEALIQAVQENKVSNVVMGTRGLGTVRRTLMGSVSDFVLHHAPPHCAVTVVKGD